MDIVQLGNHISDLRKRSNRDADLRYIHTSHRYRGKDRLDRQKLFLYHKDGECKHPEKEIQFKLERREQINQYILTS